MSELLHEQKNSCQKGAIVAFVFHVQDQAQLMLTCTREHELQLTAYKISATLSNNASTLILKCQISP